MTTTFAGPVPAPTPQTSALRVLVSGASRGIGLELVRQYAASYADNVVFAGVRNPGTAAALKAVAAAHPNVRIVALDVDSDDSVQASLAEVQRTTDRLDVLINSAGIFGEAEGCDPLKATRAQLSAALNTNVLGVLAVTQAYLPLLQRSPAPKVVHLGSRLGSNVFAYFPGHPLMLSYGLSKSALNYLNTTLRYAAPDVVFLCVHPGWVATDMGNAAGPAPVPVKDAAQAIRYYAEAKGLKNSGEFFDIISGDILPY